MALALPACNGDPAQAPAACAEPAGDPVVHQGTITKDETWTAESPHVVEGTLRISGGSTLTIERCVQVQMGEGAGFDLSADENALVTLGADDAPVRFFAEDPDVGWGNVRVLPSSTLSLAYTTIEHAGREPVNDTRRAVLDVYGDRTMPAQPLLHVDHVDIIGPELVGVSISENAGFTEDSQALTITDAGEYPLRAWAAGLTNLPDGDYTGNGRDEIVVAGGPLLFDTTIRDRGVRYLIGDELTFSTITVAAGEDGLATLTVGAGVELAFAAGGILEIENFTGVFPASGAIVAIGTEDEPVRFTSADSTDPGAWIGLYFGGVPDPSNRIENAVIEYAGGVNGTQGFNCADVENGRDQAAVIILGVPTGAFVQSTLIKDSAGFGIDRGWDGPEIDFVEGNDFEGIAWCLQSPPHNSDHSCPTDPPCPTE
jgi:hypothetical protein